MKDAILKILQDPKVETWAWESLNALILILITQLMNISALWAILAVGILNQVTKYINVNYIKKD